MDVLGINAFILVEFTLLYTNIKNVISILIAVVLMCFVSYVIAAEQQLKIIYASELPEIASEKYGDYAELATLIETHRAQTAPVLFLFGGASIGPSSLSGFDHGAHIIDILNGLEPDAMGVGKSDFSYFEDELSLRAHEAAFPIVSSNLYDPLTDGNLDELVSELLIDKQGIKVGILSIIHESVIEEYLLQRVKVLDPIKAIQDGSSRLRKQGADIVILLHQLTYPFIPNLLNSRTIDLAFTFSWARTKPRATNTPQNMLVVENQGDAAFVELTIDTEVNQVLALDWQVIELATLDKEPSVAAHVRDYDSRLETVLNQPVITIPAELDTRRQFLRTTQAPFSNLLADALRTAAHAEIGLVNVGAIRGNRLYNAGTTLTRLDIANELPYRSRISVLRLSGKDLIEALENGLSQIEEAEGRFPGVSGMQVTYRPDAPAGKRVLKVLINGKPLENDKLYKLASTDYLTNGGDGYTSLKNGIAVSLASLASPLASDIFIDHLTTASNLSFKVDNRLVATYE